SLFEAISQYLADTPHLQSLRRHPVPSSSRRRKRTSHQQNTHARCFPMGAASSRNQGADCLPRNLQLAPGYCCDCRCKGCCRRTCIRSPCRRL
ncbi:hypothetical protein CN108_34525, partial [Sinorhizobium meliloti]